MTPTSLLTVPKLHSSPRSPKCGSHKLLLSKHTTASSDSGKAC